jgi:hypothetical protein
MGLYPSTLFHFTSKEALYGILENNFRVSYARERILTKSSTYELGVPMVSFCDLTLTELKTFVGKYGSYGIGLSKAWASASGLNPVWYVSRDASVMHLFGKGMKEAFTQFKAVTKEGPDPEFLEARKNLLNTYRYVKNYHGPLVRDGHAESPDYCFADEREWRFVPEMNAGIVPLVTKDQIDTPEKKRKLNDAASGVKLVFTPDDIKYLVVERDADILPLVDHLNTVKAKKYPEDAITRLTTRILTAEQIKNDV